MQNKISTGHLLACFTVLVWGTTFISTKVLLESFTPLEILITRFVLGYLALWIVSPHFTRPSSLRQEARFALAGLCGVTLYFLMENVALTFTMASNVGVIVSVSPFFTAIFSAVLPGGEKLHPRFFAGFAAAMAGICIITFGTGEALAVNPLGDLLALLAAVVWAGYSLVTRTLAGSGMPAVQSTRRIFFYGLLFMLPAMGFMELDLTVEKLLSPLSLINLLYLGLGASALCYVTWNQALQTLGAVRASVYIYLVPVVTVVASALILHEPVTGRMAAGIVLAMAGLILSEGVPVKRRQRE